MGVLEMHPSDWPPRAWPSREACAAFVLGVVFAVASKRLLKLAVFGTSSTSAIYGLEHAKLNLALPVGSMWMNMGYWRPVVGPTSTLSSDTNVKITFQDACRNLLLLVLDTAGLLRWEGSDDGDGGGDDGDREGKDDDKSRCTTEICILDVGVGCADQTCEIFRMSRPGFDRRDDKGSSHRQNANGSTLKPCRPRLLPPVYAYIGLTDSPQQYDYARTQLERLVRQHDGTFNTTSRSFRLFCADASRPDAWGREIGDALSELQMHSTTNDRQEDEAEDGTRETWLLGLDSLYHMAPSRLPLLAWARRELDASLAAFDLLLPEPGDACTARLEFASGLSRMWREVLLRVICLSTGTPRANLLTPTAYRALLARAGYHADSHEVIITDISPHVFAALARFLDAHGRDLAPLGLGLGPLRAAGWIFGWWARSGAVRGCIVVARQRRKRT